jgi:DNA-directed RNA polymerase specialized sigma24 family protein
MVKETFLRLWVVAQRREMNSDIVAWVYQILKNRKEIF